MRQFLIVTACLALVSVSTTSAVAQGPDRLPLIGTRAGDLRSWAIDLLDRGDTTWAKAALAQSVIDGGPQSEAATLRSLPTEEMRDLVARIMEAKTRISIAVTRLDREVTRPERAFLPTYYERKWHAENDVARLLGRLETLFDRDDSQVRSPAKRHRQRSAQKLTRMKQSLEELKQQLANSEEQLFEVEQALYGALTRVETYKAIKDPELDELNDVISAIRSPEIVPRVSDAIERVNTEATEVSSDVGELIETVRRVQRTLAEQTNRLATAAGRLEAEIQMQTADRDTARPQRERDAKRGAKKRRQRDADPEDSDSGDAATSDEEGAETSDDNSAVDRDPQEDATDSAE